MEPEQYWIHFSILFREHSVLAFSKTTALVWVALLRDKVVKVESKRGLYCSKAGRSNVPTNDRKYNCAATRRRGGDCRKVDNEIEEQEKDTGKRCVRFPAEGNKHVRAADSIQGTGTTPFARLNPAFEVTLGVHSGISNKNRGKSGGKGVIKISVWP